MIKTRAKNDRHLSTPDTDKVKRCKGLSHSTSVHLFFTRLIVLSIAVGCGISHWMHVSQMHENHLTFSHLSSTERELTFRTEMGFYYSYFKQMILASNLTEAWNSLLTDIRSEVPLCLDLSEPTDQSTQPSKRKQCRPLNAMQRFNLYPELILATMYRILRSINLLQIQCYRVKRELNWNPIAIVVSPTQFAKAIQNDSILMVANETLAAAEPSVTSCVGPAEPAYFYTEVVFTLSGLILVGLCLSGWLIADRCCGDPTSVRSVSTTHPSLIGDHWLAVWGAVLPALGYFYNHREATRVQWTPPLRESFAYPFFVLQQAFLLHMLTESELGKAATWSFKRVFQFIVYCTLLLSFQLPWQFSQFALSTQIASVLVACCLTVASNPFHGSNHELLVRRVRSVISIHLVALMLSYLLQFGNALLLTSVYFPGLIGAWLGLSVLLHYLTPPGSVGVRTASTSGKYSVNRPTALDDGQVDRLGLGLTRLFFSCLFPGLITVGSTVVLCYLVNVSLGSEQQHDGGHIVDLLREKLQPGGQYRTFHTGMYTCSAEFDFIGWEALEQPIHTGLLPVAMAISATVCLLALVQLIRSLRQLDPSGLADREHSTIVLSDPDLSLSVRMPFVSLFIVIQLFFFTLMAVLIMRLKLFWTPQLCLTLALLAQPARWHQLVQCLTKAWTQIWGSKTPRASSSRSKRRSTWIAHLFLIPLVSFMSLRGIQNLKAEWNIRGQFSALDREVLVDWFRSLPTPLSGPSTPWVIAGQISVQGGLRLMLPAVRQYPSPQPLGPGENELFRAGFAFTNHPHYENAELRHRTVLAYAIYSRKSIEEAWHIYRHQLQANFVLVDIPACPARNGCSSPELYDLIHPELVGRPALCEALMTPEVQNYALTPPNWRPYFDVVYVESDFSVVVLYVHPRPLTV
ncbi:C-mannosyltransferase dpy-19 [Fasciola hepatica]|uniref:C-mannosyltransferase dpy-19 n=1 Tax=Fasciola hepatica TaxID=6192 RepID=A0A4E0RA26_FASHE|nr:C-mannosyltransferase dpy-19 [Fasciola hepatica]